MLVNDIRHKETSSEGGTSSISHAKSAPAISLQSRGDVASVDKDSESSDIQQENAGENLQQAIGTTTGEAVGQRVLDMEREKAKLSKYKKRALETAELTQRVANTTVVSSASGAKIINNLKSLANEIENSNAKRRKTFIGDLAKAIGVQKKGPNSQYAFFETKNGTIVTIRLGYHGNGADFDCFDSSYPYKVRKQRKLAADKLGKNRK